MPETEQIPEMSPYVRTSFLPSNISTMLQASGDTVTPAVPVNCLATRVNTTLQSETNTGRLVREATKKRFFLKLISLFDNALVIPKVSIRNK